MRIHFYQSVTEAWGYAFHQFSTNARLAWFPLLLIILFSMVAPYLILSVMGGELVTMADVPPQNAAKLLMQKLPGYWAQQKIAMGAFATIDYLIVTLMTASFMVPMLRLAGRGIEPSHRSVNLETGLRHVKFVIASLLTSLVIALVLYAPMQVSVYFIGQYVAEAVNTQYAQFPDPDSLHTINIVNGLDNAWMFALLNFVIVATSVIAIIYFSLRFFMVPFFAGLREKTDSYNSVKASWRLSRGWNSLKLAAVLIVLAIAQFILNLVLNIYIFPLTIAGLNAMYMLVDSSATIMATLGQEMQWLLDLLRWVWSLIRIFVNIAYSVLIYGVSAGLAGSLFRQYQKASG